MTLSSDTVYMLLRWCRKLLYCSEPPAVARDPKKLQENCRRNIVQSSSLNQLISCKKMPPKRPVQVTKQVITNPASKRIHIRQGATPARMNPTLMATPFRPGLCVSFWDISIFCLIPAYTSSLVKGMIYKVILQDKNNCLLTFSGKRGLNESQQQESPLIARGTWMMSYLHSLVSPAGDQLQK